MGQQRVRIGRATLLAFAVAVWLCSVDHLAAQTSEGLSAAAALEQALMQVIEQSEASVVSIARIRPAPLDPTVDGGRLLQRDAFNAALRKDDLLPNQFATGVILAPEQGDDRWVLTAYHPVRGGPVYGQPGSGDGSQLEVRLPSRHALAATLWAADPRCDLAVLRLEFKDAGIRPGNLRPVPWLTAAAVRKGQLAIVLGNPYWIARDGSASAGWGMISNIARRPAALQRDQLGLQSLQAIGGLFQLDYRLPIGTSGAPVLNLKGELIGLASSLAAIEGYERSGGFATPVDASTRRIIETLLSGYEVEYGFLGIHPALAAVPMSVASRGVSQPSAARVAQIGHGSPAEAAGLRADDLILAVNDEPTFTDLDLMRQVTLHPPNSEVRLTVFRRGANGETTIRAKLGKWPVADDEGVVATQRRYPLWRGLAVDYSSGRKKFSPDSKVRPAVVVTEVLPGSPAQVALLEPGVFISHVNRQPVRTPGEFADVVRAAKGAVMLWLQTDEGPPKTVTIPE